MAAKQIVPYPSNGQSGQSQSAGNSLIHRESQTSGQTPLIGRAPTQKKSAARQKKSSSGSRPLIRSAATGYVASQSLALATKQAFNDDGSLTPEAETWLTRAVTVQRPIVLANLRRLRKAHPTLTNRQLAAELDKDFARSMTGGGALIGATSAVPGVGTVTSLGLSALATGSFLEMCALYAQSLAELSGISTEDPQRAKLMVMGIMLGDEGRKLLGELSEHATGKGRGPVASLVPLASGPGPGSASVSGLVAQQIKRQFVKRFFFRQGTSMLGRAIPYGIGAVVGGVGNRALAKQITRSAHQTFGELPEETPPALIEDFKRGLGRERLRADRKERRGQKKALKSDAKAQRKAVKQLRQAAEHQEADEAAPENAQENEATPGSPQDEGRS